MGDVMQIMGDVMQIKCLALLVELLLASKAAAQSPDDFLPIDLKCPHDNHQTLEVLQQNSIGQRERIRVMMDATGAIAFAELAAAEAGGNYDAITIAGSELDDPDAAAYAEDYLLARARTAGGHACDGTAAELQDELEVLKRNRVALGIE